MREVLHNVALRVEETEDPDKFKVSGRGELHLSVLIETMRREGYELAVSRPEVILKEVDGESHEPYEQLVVDMEEQFQGGVMERLGTRKGQLKNMEPDGTRPRAPGIPDSRARPDRLPDRVPHAHRGHRPAVPRVRSLRPARGRRDRQAPERRDDLQRHRQGTGLFAGRLQERGRLLIDEGAEIYEGQLVGIHAKDNDLTVNALRAKQLTNIRAAGKDENVQLTPAIKMSLEQALEFIDDDELVEVTPKAIRLRKKHLTENDRKKASRQAA